MSHPSDASFVLSPPYSGEAPPIVNGAALSPDGARLAVLYTLRNQPNKDEPRLRLWTLADRTFRNLPLNDDRLDGLCWPTDDTVVAGGYGRVRVLPVDERPPRDLRTPSNTSAHVIASLPGERKIVVFQGEVVTLDLDGGPVARTEHKTYDFPAEVIVASGGDIVATRAAEAYLRIFSRAKGVQLHRLHSGGGSAAAFSPDGRWLVYGDDAEGRLIVLDRRTKDLAEVRRIPGAARAGSLCFSPDGALLAGVAGFRSRSDTWLRVWDFATGALRYERIWPCEGLRHLQFARDGSVLFAAEIFGGSVFGWETARF
jgi:WD40 repeat protein